VSAPLAAQVLRELGARPRRFRSVAGAMSWWRNEKLRRGARGISLESGMGSAPRSRESIEETAATFASITRCLAARDTDFDLEDWPLSEWRIWAYADWVGSTEDRCKNAMAERLGWSVEVAERFMGETARVLSRRMRGRGVIA